MLLPQVPRCSIAVPVAVSNNGDAVPVAVSNNGWYSQFCRFTPDNKAVVFCDETAIRVWNASTGTIEGLFARPAGANNGRTDIVMAPTGRRILIYDSSCNAPLLIDLETGQRVELPPFGDDNSIHFTGGFARLVAFGPNGDSYVRSDWAPAVEPPRARYFRGANQLSATWQLPGDAENFAFVPNGQTAAAVVNVYDETAHARLDVVSLIRPGTGRLIATVRTRENSYGIPAFSPDGRTLATSGIRYRGEAIVGLWLPSTVQLWDVPTLRRQALLSNESLVGWCPSGRVVTASEDIGLAMPGPALEIRLRDGRTGALIAEYPVPQPGGEWLPDTFQGHLVAARLNQQPPAWRTWLAQHVPWKQFAPSDAAALQIIDVETGQEVARLPESLENIALSPDGRAAAVVGKDEIHIWDIPPRKPFGWFILTAIILAPPIAWLARRRVHRLRREAA
jgi:WD40 repeat protein